MTSSIICYDLIVNQFGQSAKGLERKYHQIGCLCMRRMILIYKRNAAASTAGQRSQARACNASGINISSGC